MERVLVSGDRGWNNYQVILDELIKVHQEYGIEVVIEGECSGADQMARAAAVQLGIPYLPFPADWRKHGRAAGPIRNRQMITEGKPTLVLLFHPFIENSKGTRDMQTAANQARVRSRVITGRENGNSKSSS